MNTAIVGIILLGVLAAFGIGFLICCIRVLVALFMVGLVGMWFVVVAGMVGMSSIPVLKKVLERDLSAQQASHDQLARR